MGICEDRYRRDRHAFDLAWRLLGLGARTNTIARWTGLTRGRIRALQRTYGEEMSGFPQRPRGRSPFRIERLLSSRRARAQAATLVGLFQHLGIPIERAPAKLVAPVELCEDICDAFESFRAEVPGAELGIEEALLLFMALRRADEVVRSHCRQCGSVALFDLLQPGPQRCPICVAGELSDSRGPADPAAVRSGAGAALQESGSPARYRRRRHLKEIAALSSSSLPPSE